MLAMPSRRLAFGWSMPRRTDRQTATACMSSPALKQAVFPSCVTRLSASEPTTSNLALVGIGVFKLLKCAFLVAMGVAMIHWRDHDVGHFADRWRQSLPI